MSRPFDKSVLDDKQTVGPRASDQTDGAAVVASLSPSRLDRRRSCQPPDSARGQDFDGDSVPRHPRQPPVQRHEGAAQLFGQRDVQRVVGGEVVTQFPPARQQILVTVPIQLDLGEISQRRRGASLGHRSPTQHCPQRLGNFRVEEMRGVKVFIGKAILDVLPKPERLDHDGRVDHDHPARISRLDRALFG